MSRAHALTNLLNATSGHNGEYWECGAFRGDLVSDILGLNSGTSRIFRLFDTFSGQPYSGPHDFHLAGSMNETSCNEVCERFAGMSNVVIHSGIMPETFAGLENKTISVANIDVDNYDSVKACLEWVYPRVHSGGYIVVDDYTCGGCLGAKIATDEFLTDKPELLTGDDGHAGAYFVKL